MAGSVTIKSYNKGLSVHLDPNEDIETIKKDLADTFMSSASFFKNAQMVISFEDRELNSTLERELVNIIMANSDVQVTCIAGKNKLTQQLITNALKQVEYKNEVQSNVVEVYTGNLKDGRVIDIAGSILILGDVYPGASVVATGDIYVYGGLFGQAYAGTNGDESKIIASLDMNPEKLRIAGIKYKPTEKPKWSIKNKQVPIPKVAYVNEYSIDVENVSKDFWNKLFENKEDI